MKEVSICICTRKREDELKKLLESIENMHRPDNIVVSIVIIENDLSNYSEHIVKEFSSRSEYSIRYFLEKNQGISNARNRSVKESSSADFCCFVDDDQIVDSEWMVELIKCQMEFNADGVTGPNPPVFPEDVPSYIEKFHQPLEYSYGSIVETAFTNCLLLKKEFLDNIKGPFDIRLNFTGGEDSYLTFLISKMGGIIRSNPNAIAYEIVPSKRTTIKYILKRQYRISNTGIYVKLLKKEKTKKVQFLPRLLMRFGLGLLIAVPFFIFGKINKLKGLLKISDAVGGFIYIIGKENKFYK